MSSFTPNYNLLKVDDADVVDEETQLSQNWDIVDTVLFENHEGIQNEENARQTLEAAFTSFKTALEASWASFTPTFTGSTDNGEVGNSTLTGAKRVIGKTVQFRIKHIVNTSVTADLPAGNWRYAIPHGTEIADRWHFNGIIRYGTGESHLLVGERTSSGIITLRYPKTYSGAAPYVASLLGTVDATSPALFQ